MKDGLDVGWIYLDVCRWRCWFIGTRGTGGIDVHCKNYKAKTTLVLAWRLPLIAHRNEFCKQRSKVN